ncbi:MAG: SSU ribosomal protein S15p (S13e), partial [uncultured Blastococcus sp.]
GARERSQEADHDRVRHGRERHRIARGPGRDADQADQRPHRAPQDAQARPPQPAGPAPAGGPSSPPAELPGQDRHHPLPLAHRAAGSAPL